MTFDMIHHMSPQAFSNFVEKLSWFCKYNIFAFSIYFHNILILFFFKWNVFLEFHIIWVLFWHMQQKM